MGRQPGADPPAGGEGAIEEELEHRVGPYLSEHGYDLVEVTYRRERRGWVLRLTVDRLAGGLTVEQAVQLSREVGALIDADPKLDALLVGPYDLEVSSPGIFRQLKRPRDFERAWGKRVRVRWEPEPGRTQELTGTLDAFGEGRLVLGLDDGTTLNIDTERLQSARLDPELPFGKRSAGG